MNRKEAAARLRDLEADLLKRQHDLEEECNSLRKAAQSLEDRLRIDRLEQIAILDTPPEPVFEELLELLSSLSEYEGAMLTFIDAERAFIKGSVDHSKLGSIPREQSLCNVAIQKADQVIVIADAMNDDRYKDLQPVKEGLRTYAGKAIKSRDGVPIGAVCLVDSHTKAVTDSEIIALEKASNIISHILAMRTRNG